MADMATAKTTKQNCIDMEISGISKLESIRSSKISIHGIPWEVEVRKEEDDEEQFLGVYLYCVKDDKSPEWSLWASASFKLLPFSDDAIPIEYRTPVHVYGASVGGYGTSSLIKWNDLFNLDNKYVKDDTINLEFKVSAENPNDANRSRCKVENLQKCCANSYFIMFQFNVTNVSNLMAIRSNAFPLRGLLWDIQVSRMRSSHLGVSLNLREDPVGKAIRTTMIIKLMSTNKNIKMIEKCYTQEWQYLHNSSTKVVSWDEMVKAENGFINDNAITLEVGIHVYESKVDLPIPKRAKLNPENETKIPTYLPRVN